MTMQNNPFSKNIENAEQVSVIDENIQEMTPDTECVVKWFTDHIPDLKLTNDEISELNELDRSKKIEWMKLKSADYKYGILNNSLENLLSKGDVFKNVKDPLSITADDIDSLMKFKTTEEHSKEISVIVNSARKQLKREKLSEYVKQRNVLNANGELDTFVSASELAEIDREVENDLKSISKRIPGLKDSEKLAGLVNTFNSMSIDSRYAYEGYKEGVCNDFGITPESFDEFMSHVIEDNNVKLQTEGINIRTDLYKISDIHKKNAHYLKKVPNWTRGDIVYKSEFNEKLREKEAEELRNGKGTDESKQLFKAMVVETYHTLDNPVKAKKGQVSKDDVREFIRNRRSKNKPITPEKNDEKTKQVVEVKKETKPEIDLRTLVTLPPKSEEEVITKEEQAIRDLEAKNKELEEKIKKLEQNSVQIKNNGSDREIDDSFEVSNIIPDQININKNAKYTPETNLSFKDISTYKAYEADTSILNRPGNRVEILKAYRESAKRGRTLFLINSNYEVYVKKIKSTESINYMMSLINDIKDMNLVDAYVKSEVLRVCYDNIEFPFEEHVTYNDFVKCLHESDMTILMVMLALVNIPETEDGKVPLEISSVICTNPECGAIGNLKNKLKLDLKEEFVNLYPTEKYAASYSAYKAAGYKNIYQAYRSSTVGTIKPFKCVEDDGIEYSCLLSAPTVYKTQTIKSCRDEVSYRRVLDRFKERLDTYDDQSLTDIIDYMEDNTYYNFTAHMIQVAEDPNKVKLRDREILTKISDELEIVRQNDTPWYLMADVIDRIDLTTKDGIEIVSNLDQSDMYTLVGILEQSPRAILDALIEVKQETISNSLAIDITFSNEDLAGNFDFDGYYGTEEEMIAEVRRRNEKTNLSEEQINKIIDAQKKLRDDVKPKYEDEAICLCGRKEWKLNYTTILFFWMSNQSLTQVK